MFDKMSTKILALLPLSMVNNDLGNHSVGTVMVKRQDRPVRLPDMLFGMIIGQAAPHA